MKPDDSRVQEVLEQAQRNAADEAASQVDDIFGSVVDKVESPIEQVFLAAFVPAQQMDPLSYRIEPQVKVGRYRVDFVVTFTFSAIYDPVRVVVECDGHEFHEKTKRQAERDKTRDRFLTAQGYTVMRFSGSELWRDPFAKVEEVIDYTQGVMMIRQHEDWRRRREEAKLAAGDPGEVPW